MRVHIFLFAFFAASTLTRGAPASEEGVDNREAADETETEKENEMYRNNFFGNGPPNPNVADNNQGMTQKSNENVYISVSRWTLETIYDFVNRLYDKLKVMVSYQNNNHNVPNFSNPNQDNSQITNDDLQALYSILYSLYNLLEQNNLNGDGTASFPGQVGVQQQQQQQQQQLTDFYPMGVGSNPSAYASASAAAISSSRPSNNHKRSYGSELTKLDEDMIKKTARMTVRNILRKLDAMLNEREAQHKVTNENNTAIHDITMPAAAETFH